MKYHGNHIYVMYVVEDGRLCHMMKYYPVQGNPLFTFQLPLFLPQQPVVVSSKNVNNWEEVDWYGFAYKCTG